MLNKKKSIATITKKTHRQLSKGINFHRFVDWLRGNIIATTGLINQTVNKNAFVLTLSQGEVVKKFAC